MPLSLIAKEHILAHTPNTQVRKLVTDHITRHVSILTTAKKRKLWWFGHITRAKGRLVNIILEGS